MKNNNPKAASSYLVAALLAFGFVVLAFGKVAPVGAGPGVPDPSSSLPKACSAEQVATEVMVAAGFSRHQFAVGEDHFNLSLPAVNDAAAGKFAPKSLTSQAKLQQYLSSSTAAAKLTIGAAKQSTGASESVVLDTDNWVGIQMTVPVYWDGNTLFKGGSMVAAGKRVSARGDIGWIFIDPSDCHAGRINVANVFILRGPCGNPQEALPRPQR